MMLHADKRTLIAVFATILLNNFTITDAAPRLSGKENVPPVYYSQEYAHENPASGSYTKAGEAYVGTEEESSGCTQTYDDPDGDCITGIANVDYPVLSRVPETSFSCQDFPYSGYFADTETLCQVFHICQEDGRHDSFLCPNGTIFSQAIMTCEWWYNVDCSSTALFYQMDDLTLGLVNEGQYGYRRKRNDVIDSTDSTTEKKVEN